MKAKNKGAFTICVWLSFAFFFLNPPVLYSLPQGEEVIEGSATFNTSGNTLDVTASDNAIIQYTSFNIAQGETVNFLLPGSDAMVLNRILGGGTSEIYGTLTANGNIVLINENGFYFGATSMVNVGGLIASTHNITNANFLAGNYLFSGLGNTVQSSQSSILNEGSIQATNNGMAVLIADAIENRGTIQAPLGTVALAAGNLVTVTIGPNGLSIAIDEATAHQILDKDGNPITEQIKNSGTLEAGSGTVEINAQAADQIFETAINLQGVVRADNMVVGQNGSIQIVGNGDIISDATVSASQGTITFEAEGDIQVEGSYEAVNGTVTFQADQTLEVTDTVTTKGDTTFKSKENLTVTADVTTDSGALNFLADFDLDGVGAFLQSAGTTLKTLTSGDITLSSSGASTLANIISAGSLILNQAGAVVNYTQHAGSQITTQGAITIGSGVTLTAANTVYEIGGDFVNQGSFLAELSLVKLVGASTATVLGNNTFYNLEINSPGKVVRFDSAKIQEIIGTLTLRGGFGDLLTITSTHANIPWKINATGTTDIQFVRIQNSNNININGPPLAGQYMQDALGNTNWDFSGAGPVWTGAGSSSSWFDLLNWNGGFIPGIGDIVTFSADFDVNSSVDPNFSGTIRGLTLEAGYEGVVTLNRDLTVTGDVALLGGTLAGGSHQLTVGGGWNQAGGVFQYDTSTVVFNDVNQVSTVLGNTTFYNLKIETPDKEMVFEAGSTTTVLNDVRIVGAPDQGADEFYVKFTSTQEGVNYFLDFQPATTFIERIRLQDSHFVNYLYIPIGGEPENGNNINVLIDPIWDGGGGDNNWSTPNNWDGNAVPTGTEVVNFNGTTGPNPDKDVTIDNVGSWSGGNIIIGSGYTGTITLSTNITVNDFTMSGGTWVSGNNTLDINGNFTINNANADFTAPGSSGAFRIAGDFTVSNGTFDPNGGTLEFDGSSGNTTLNVNTSETFNNLIINKGGGQLAQLQNGDTFIVLGDLTLTDGGILGDTATFEVRGNISVGNAWDDTSDSQDLVLRVTGGNAQTITLTDPDDLGLSVLVNKSANSLTLLSAWTLNNTNQTLTVQGGTLDLNGQALTVSTHFNNTITVNGGTLTIGTGTLTHSSGATFTLSNGVVNQGSTTLTFAENFVQTGGTFNGSAATLDIGESFSISAGTFTAPSGTMQVEESFTVSGTGNFDPNGGTLEFNGSGDNSTINVNSSETFNHVTINKGSGQILFFQDDDTFTIAGNLTLTNGSIMRSGGGSAPTVAVQGNVSVGAGWDNSDGTDLTLTFTGGGTQTFSGSLNQLNTSIAVNKSGNRVSQTANFAVASSATFTIIEGVYDINGNNLTVADGTGSFIVQDGGVLELFGTQTVTDPTLNDGSIVRFTGNGDTNADTYTINSLVATYEGLEIVSVDANDVFQITTTLNVDDTLTVTSGILDLNGNNIADAAGGDMAVRGNIGGTIRLQGTETVFWTTNDTDSGTYEYDGSAAQCSNCTIKDFGANDYFNLVINGTGTFDLGANLNVDGNFTITQGTVDVTAAACGGGSCNINVASNWSNSGTFTARTGTVTFDGGNQSITGSTTFYNFTKTDDVSDNNSETLTFDNTATQTITNVLTLTGTDSDDRVLLVSDSPGTQWSLNSNGTESINFVTTTDSDASGGTLVTHTNTTSGGNNLNWGFEITFSGNVYTNEAQSANIGAGVTIGLSINGGATQTVLSTSAGAFSFSVDAGSGQTVAIFVDDHGSHEATYITVSNGSNLTGIEMYTNKVVLSHATAGPITNTNLSTADNGDSDIHYNVAGGTATFEDGFEVFVESGKTYAPGGDVVLDDIDINGTFTMAANAVTVSGTWDAAGGTFTGTGTTTFDSTAAETITSNTGSFGNVTFNGVSGSWVQQDAMDVNGDVTITNGTFNSSGEDITVAGGWSNSGTYTSGSNTVTFDGTGDHNINTGGTGTGNDFNNLVINRTSGTLSLITNDLDIDGTFQVSGATLDANGRSVTAGGLMTVNGGTYTAGSGTTTANAGMTVSSGTFTGASNTTLDVNGDFTFSGGSFTAPGSSGSWTVQGNFTQTNSPTFNANGGTLTFDGVTFGVTVNAPGITFNQVTINKVAVFLGAGTFTVAANTTLPLGNNPTIRLEDTAQAPITDFVNNGTLSGTGTLTFTPDQSTFSSRLTNNGTISGFTAWDINSDFTQNASGTASNVATVNVTGDFIVNAASTFPNNGTINFDGPPQAVTVDTSGITWTLANINKTAPLGTGGTFTINANTTLPLGNNATITLNDTAQAPQTDFTNNGTITVGTGTFTINLETGGSTFTNNGTIRYNGTTTQSVPTGTFTNASGSTVIFGSDTDAAQDTFTLTNFGTSFYHVTVDSTDPATNDIWQLGAAIELDGTLTVTSGILDLNGNNISDAAGGDTAARGNIAGTIRLIGTETVFWTTNDTDSGTYEYKGDNTATNLNLLQFTGADYFNLVINDTNATERNYRHASALDIEGDLTITDGTLDSNGQNVTVAGGWVNTGGTYTSGSNTVTFDGAGDHNINTGGTGTGNDFNNVVINKTNATDTLTLITNDLDIDGTLTITQGELAANGRNVTVGGLFTLNGGTYLAGSGTTTANAGMTVSSGTFTGASNTTLDVNGNFNMSNGAFTAPGSSGSFTVSDDFDISGGTFTHNSGTLTLDGDFGNNSIDANGVSFNLVALNKTDNSGVSGAFTIAANTTLPLGASPTITFTDANSGLTTNITNNGTLSGTGTLTFNPDGTPGTATGGTFTNNGTISGFTTWDMNGHFTQSATGTSSNVSTVTAAGSFTVNTASTFPNSGTITFDGNACNCSVDTDNVTWTSAVINKTGTDGISSTFTIDAGTTLPLGASPTITFTDANSGLTTNITNNGTLSGTGTLTFNPDGTPGTATGGTFTNNGTISGFTTWDINGHFTQGAAGVASNVSTVTAAGSFTVNSASTFPNNGTITFDGNACNCSVDTDNVTWTLAVINKTGADGISSTFTIDAGTTLPLGNSPSISNFDSNNGFEINVTNNGTLTVGTGTLTITLDTGGSSTFTNNGTIRYNGTTTQTVTVGSFVNASGSTVIFGSDTDAAQDTFTLTNFGTSFYHVTVDSTDPATNDIWQLGGAIELDGTLTVTSGILDLNGNNISDAAGGDTAARGNIGGTIRLRGTESVFWTSNDTDSGTYEFVGSLAQCNPCTITDFGATDYFNLLINGAGVFQLGNGMVIAGTHTVSAGTYNANGQTTTVTGLTTVNGGTYLASTATQTHNGGLTVSSGAYTGGSGDIDINGNLTIGAAGTFTASSSTMSTTISGNLSNSGIFNHNNGTVDLDGGDQTITGAFTFNNLTKTVAAQQTLTFDNTAAQTVAGTLTLKGVSQAARLLLRSDSATDAWDIDPQGTLDVEFLDVRDSNNTNATAISCANGCLNSNGNTNWLFDAASGSGSSSTASAAALDPTSFFNGFNGIGGLGGGIALATPAGPVFMPAPAAPRFVKPSVASQAAKAAKSQSIAKTSTLAPPSSVQARSAGSNGSESGKGPQGNQPGGNPGGFNSDESSNFEFPEKSLFKSIQTKTTVRTIEGLVYVIPRIQGASRPQDAAVFVGEGMQTVAKLNQPAQKPNHFVRLGFGKAGFLQFGNDSHRFYMKQKTMERMMINPLLRGKSQMPSGKWHRFLKLGFRNAGFIELGDGVKPWLYPFYSKWIEGPQLEEKRRQFK